VVLVLLRARERITSHGDYLEWPCLVVYVALRAMRTHNQEPHQYRSEHGTQYEGCGCSVEFTVHGKFLALTYT